MCHMVHPNGADFFPIFYHHAPISHRIPVKPCLTPQNWMLFGYPVRVSCGKPCLNQPARSRMVDPLVDDFPTGLNKQGTATHVWELNTFSAMPYLHFKWDLSKCTFRHQASHNTPYCWYLHVMGCSNSLGSRKRNIMSSCQHIEII